MAAEAPPRFTRRQDVPRDLRPAKELAQHGYYDLGPIRATLAVDGMNLALYSTSEARRRRDKLWPHRSRSGVRPAAPSARVKRLPLEDVMVVDTETTGLGRRDEIIELSVIDARGVALLETLLWPHSGHVPASASRIHGLSIDDLAGAPTWPEILPQLRSLVGGRRVLAWNAPFDERMARQTSRIWGVPHGLPAFECAMRAYALARELPNGRRLSLAAAAAQQGLLQGAQRHRSSDDARLTLAVLRSLVEPAD